MDAFSLPQTLRHRFRREWLVFFLAAALLLALTLWYAGGLGREQGYAALQDRITDQARGQAGIIETLRNKFGLLPAALAQDETVQRALTRQTATDIAALNQKFDRLAHSIGANVLYLLDTQGRTLASSNWQAADSFVGGDFRFRPYFSQAMAKGQAEYFALGTSSGQEGLYISRRVQGAEGQPIGVVVIKLEFTRLEESWRQHHDMMFVTDPQGIILLTSQPDWRFRTLAPLPLPQREAILASRQFGQASLQPLQSAGPQRIGPSAAPSPSVPTQSVRTPGTDTLLHIDGTTYLQQSQAIPGSDWTLHALAPTQEAVLHHTLRARLTAAAYLATMLGLAALLLWRSQQRRSHGARQLALQQALQQAVETRTHELHLSNQRLEQEMQALRQARARARTLRDQLEQAEKLSFLGQITAGVAHEVNQPVAAIQAYADNADVLLTRGDLDTTRQNLAAISQLTQRIGLITSQLRHYARKPAEDAMTVPVRTALDNALTLLSPRARRDNVRIDLSGIVDGLCVQAAQVRLEQVFVNLIRNALDAMSGQPDALLRITAAPAGDAMVRIVFRDNGPGIPDSVRSTLFTPFSTSRSEGLGLGLAISRDIILALGGTLQEQPAPTGAMFIVTLPSTNPLAS